MILYTMMPQEQVFPVDAGEFSEQMSVPIDGGHLVVQRLDSGRYKVIQLISGDASMYLKPHFTPGAFIEANDLI